MAGSRRSGQLGDRLFSVIDVDGAEEQAYLLLLEHPGSTLSEVAEYLQTPKPRVRRLLEALETKGLLTRSPERLPRFLPVPPDVAVDALIARKQDELDQARAAATRLTEQARRLASRRAQEEVAEVITGAVAVAQRFNELQAAAEREVLAFDRPPYAQADRVNAVELDNLERGVAYRAIYDREALEAPSGVEHFARYAKAGEQSRVFSPLPGKLMIFDHHVALIPHLAPDGSEVTGGVLLRARPLLGMLVLCFEMIWDRATPMRLDAAGQLAAPEPEDGTASSAELGVLVSLLASGLKDEAIAQQLGVSGRTLDRRVRTLMGDLDAATRFQAGWLAAQRIEGVEPPKRSRRTARKRAAKPTANRARRAS